MLVARYAAGSTSFAAKLSAKVKPEKGRPASGVSRGCDDAPLSDRMAGLSTIAISSSKMNGADRLLRYTKRCGEDNQGRTDEYSAVLGSGVGLGGSSSPFRSAGLMACVSNLEPEPEPRPRSKNPNPIADVNSSYPTMPAIGRL